MDNASALSERNYDVFLRCMDMCLTLMRLILLAEPYFPRTVHSVFHGYERLKDTTIRLGNIEMFVFFMWMNSHLGFSNVLEMVHSTRGSSISSQQS